MSSHGPHKDKHAHGGGGGHGGSWIVTYSDMITLLMAFFICIITFASRETEKYSPKRDSLINGTGATGVAGPGQLSSLSQDAVIWRVRFRPGRVTEVGPEFAPLYRDPSLEMSARILGALAGVLPGTLANSYSFRLPLSLLVGADGKVTPSGVHILDAVAANLRELPFDFHLLVHGPGQIDQAVRLASCLSTRGGVHPSRVPVGIRPEDGNADSLWLVLVRQS